jgi:hypothetical protein
LYKNLCYSPLAIFALPDVPAFVMEKFGMPRRIRLETRIYDWRVTALVIRSVVLLSFLLLSAFDRSIANASMQQAENSSRVQAEKDALPLELARPIERNLVGGQKHYYKIVLESGQYLRLIVDQRGIDVIVALFDFEGKKLVEVDSPTGAYGSELVSVISDAATSYLLEVRSAEKDVVAGRYEVNHPPLNRPKRRF